MTALRDNRVYLAIDTPDLPRAILMARVVREAVGGIKLGLEFFCRNGHAGVEAVRSASALPIFLDLKFHDIPNTVAGAVRSIVSLRPAIINVHASGGLRMMVEAREAAEGEAERLGLPVPKIIAVTMLTSLTDVDMADVGIETATMTDQVRRLAALAYRADLAGVVCSPMETAVLREDLGPDFLLVTPGVRPVGTDLDDQKRIMTPADAVACGADLLVIGRPITGADDPYAAACAIRDDLARIAP